MWQAKGWRRSMMAWALVEVLMVGLWAMPGWAWKPKGVEKPKPIDGEIAGLLVAIEAGGDWCGVGCQTLINGELLKILAGQDENSGPD